MKTTLKLDIASEMKMMLEKRQNEGTYCASTTSRRAHHVYFDHFGVFSGFIFFAADLLSGIPKPQNNPVSNWGIKISK